MRVSNCWTNLCSKPSKAWTRDWLSRLQRQTLSLSSLLRSVSKPLISQCRRCRTSSMPLHRLSMLTSNLKLTYLPMLVFRVSTHSTWHLQWKVSRSQSENLMWMEQQKASTLNSLSLHKVDRAWSVMLSSQIRCLQRLRLALELVFTRSSWPTTMAQHLLSSEAACQTWRHSLEILVTLTLFLLPRLVVLTSKLGVKTMSKSLLLRTETMSSVLR